MAISPHLDDAVFSAGGTLSQHARMGDGVTVLTCFTGNVARPTGFALACQLDKGLSPDVDYMLVRRKEDEAACEAIGANPVHLPFLEAPHRGYDNKDALFAGHNPVEDQVGDPLAQALAREIERLAPTIIYAPYGVGNHVDHEVVRKAITSLRLAAHLIWWEDFPYAMNRETAPSDIERRQLDDAAAQAKLRGVLCYKSQLDFQFGSTEEAAQKLSRWNCEGFTSAFQGSGTHPARPDPLPA
nr:PIG-L family deacetylase [Porphyrobacter sp. GA68]